MDRKTISEQLRKLALDDENRSKSTRLNSVINDVEEAITLGVRYSLIVEKLAENGLEMSVQTFGTTLQRIRKKNGKKSAILAVSTNQHPNPSANPAEISPTTEAETEPQSRTNNSHDPAELRKIFASKPDLDALAKIAKSIKRKQS